MSSEAQSSINAEQEALLYAIRVLLANHRPSLLALQAAIEGTSKQDAPMKKETEKVLKQLIKESKESMSPAIDIRCAEISQETEGVWTIKSPSWPGGRLMWMNRNAFNHFRKHNAGLFSKVGIYFLWSNHFEREEKGSLYIGETKRVKDRLDQHRSKDFWTHVAIVSADDLTKSHAVTAEAKFIAQAKNANRYALKNENDGQEEPLPPRDTALVENVVSAASALLRLANFDFLELSLTGVFEYRSNSMGRTYLFRVRLVDAQAKLVTILAGSQLSAGDDVPKEVQKAGLTDKGKLQEKCWVFAEDVSVTLNGALGNVLGHISATSLKSENGVSLYKILDQASRQVL